MFIILQETYHGIKKCERFGRTEQLSWCYIWFLTIGSRNSPTDAPGCLIKLMIPGGWKHLCEGVCVASSAQSCPHYHDEQIVVSSTMAAFVAQNMQHSQALISRINMEQKCSADVLSTSWKSGIFSSATWRYASTCSATAQFYYLPLLTRKRSEQQSSTRWHQCVQIVHYGATINTPFSFPKPHVCSHCALESSRWFSTQRPCGIYVMDKNECDSSAHRLRNCLNAASFHFYLFMLWFYWSQCATVYLSLSVSHTHTHTHGAPCAVFSCRSRPDCPFRCNLICTPIILFFSGGCCVSRVISQHVHLLSPSNCHVLLAHASHVSVSSFVTPPPCFQPGTLICLCLLLSGKTGCGWDPSFFPLCWSDSHWSQVKVFSFPSITGLSTQIRPYPPSGFSAYSVILLLTVNFCKTI